MRFKETLDKKAVEIGKRLRELTSNFSIPFIVNDRPDIALLCGADAVHVGQKDIPPDVVYRSFGKLAVGFSTHNLYQVRQSKNLPVNYIGFGPVFGTKSKLSPYPATGIMKLRMAAKISNAPVVAIGGIDDRNCKMLVEAGVRRAAVISAIYHSSDPYLTAKTIHSILTAGL